MADEIVHKLIMPPPRDGNLNDLVLCWNELGAPAPDQIRHTRYTTSINSANCTDCWRIWVRRGTVPAGFPTANPSGHGVDK